MVLAGTTIGILVAAAIMAGTAHGMSGQAEVHLGDTDDLASSPPPGTSGLIDDLCHVASLCKGELPLGPLNQ